MAFLRAERWRNNHRALQMMVADQTPHFYTKMSGNYIISAHKPEHIYGCFIFREIWGELQTQSSALSEAA
jgi:hypothetical protein